MMSEACQESSRFGARDAESGRFSLTPSVPHQACRSPASVNATFDERHRDGLQNCKPISRPIRVSLTLLTQDHASVDMKFSVLLIGALSSLAYLGTTSAAKSFSASNLYYAAGLKDAQQSTLLEGLQSAGVKVLRVWLDGNVTPPIAAHQY